MAMQHVQVRQQTVRILARQINLFTDADVFSVPEGNTIISNLRNLAKHGDMIPPIQPKLITLKETAEMLGIAPSNFRKLEKEKAFPFNRRMLGGSIRFRNIDIIKYIMTSDEEERTEIEVNN